MTKPLFNDCLNCGKLFEPKDSCQKFCDTKCGAKYRNNQEKLAQQRAFQRMRLILKAE